MAHQVGYTSQVQLREQGKSAAKRKKDKNQGYEMTRLDFKHICIDILKKVTCLWVQINTQY